MIEKPGRSNLGRRTGFRRLEKANNSSNIKKGNKADCNNLRGVAVLSVVCKVFSKAILNQLKPLLDNQLKEDQCGFRPNRGCTDQIFDTRILIQRAREFNTPTFLCFVDLCKAYDSVNTDEQQ